ncbi:MAG: hypothetical protein Q8L48_10155 [Archangium sp.]|nr:hypothetical protein [Archangium sp.]
MLYERARQLQSKGMTAAEIHRVLLGEGAREEDIKVILGSLGLGPQPQPDPTQQPLALAKRIMESRGLRLALFVGGAAAVAALLSVLWIVATVAWSVVEGFTRGR